MKPVKIDMQVDKFFVFSKAFADTFGRLDMRNVIVNHGEKLLKQEEGNSEKNSYFFFKTLPVPPRTRPEAIFLSPPIRTGSKLVNAPEI